jgi:hypothetical protein
VCSYTCITLKGSDVMMVTVDCVERIRIGDDGVSLAMNDSDEFWLNSIDVY